MGFIHQKTAYSCSAPKQEGWIPSFERSWR
jgi:hypothetical protein